MYLMYLTYRHPIGQSEKALVTEGLSLDWQVISPATEYVVFRASSMPLIRASSQKKGGALVKSRNAEQGSVGGLLICSGIRFTESNFPAGG